MKARKKRTTKSSSKSAAKTASAENLLESVQERLDEVRTKVVDYSFNELFDMQQSGELIIRPDFQRLFKWDLDKRSQFIESLILELPIPPIYVVEEDDGTYELIDGLQRFSSYLHFRGVLLDTKTEEELEPLVLVGCDIVKELNGMTFLSLPTSLQVRLKRMSVSVQILRRESDRKLRYHMFRRLNTGGMTLSHQEIRNATIHLLGNRFNSFIQRLSQVPDFATCTEIMSAETKEGMGREECVLRYFAFKNDFPNYVKLIKPFLDDYLERVTEDPDLEDFDYDSEEDEFRRTFEIFRRSLGGQSFSTVSTNNSFGNQFSMSHFDMLTQGIQPHLSALSSAAKSDPAELRTSLKKLKLDPGFRKATTGGGKNYYAAYNRTIKMVSSHFGTWLKTI